MQEDAAPAGPDAEALHESVDEALVASIPVDTTGAKTSAAAPLEQ